MPSVKIKKSFTDKTDVTKRIKAGTTITVDAERAAKLIEYGYAVASSDPEAKLVEKEETPTKKGK